MALNEQLLNKARAAGAALAEAERGVQQARAGYHALVRRMHLAGGSLREIAHALDLSHQRVQQMVEAAGGSWWQRVWGARVVRTDMACTYCRRTKEQVAKLIAGPKVFICDACVAMAERCLDGGPHFTAEQPLRLAGKRARARCSFCSKRRDAQRSLLTGSDGNICNECLIICRQILHDSTP